jgi:hypothetical protein
MRPAWLRVAPNASAEVTATATTAVMPMSRFNVPP